MEKSELAKIINERLEGYNTTTIEMNMRIQRQARLKNLTRKFSVEIVARAAGLTMNTLQQYLRVKIPTSIAESTVIQAETILEGL